MSGRDEVLISGASGLVGSEVAARLTAAGRSVTAVVHRTADLVSHDGAAVTGVAQVSGDIRRAGFGLSAPADAELSRRIGVIVHTAATTAFDATDEQYEQLNVRGAAHAIELALRWDVPLVHVSTAYVCGRRDATVAESDLDTGQSFGNGYEQSKFRAEQMVRDAPGLRWAIVRPGIVTGATDTGAIRDYKNLYTVVKLMVEGKLRSLPGRYDATIALAPVDHVADVVAAVTRDIDAATGKTFHAVGRETLSLREVSDVLAEYPSFHVATFVPEASFAVEDLDPVEREYYLRIGALYVGYFIRRVRFDTANTEALLGYSSPESGKEYLRTLLDYCLESGYLGTPLPSIEDVLAADGAGDRR